MVLQGILRAAFRLRSLKLYNCEVDKCTRLPTQLAPKNSPSLFSLNALEVLQLHGLDPLASAHLLGNMTCKELNQLEIGVYKSYEDLAFLEPNAYLDPEGRKDVLTNEALRATVCLFYRDQRVQVFNMSNLTDQFNRSPQLRHVIIGCRTERVGNCIQALGETTTSNADPTADCAVLPNLVKFSLEFLDDHDGGHSQAQIDKDKDSLIGVLKEHQVLLHGMLLPKLIVPWCLNRFSETKLASLAETVNTIRCNRPHPKARRSLKHKMG